MIDTMTQISHVCLASECTKNNFKLLQREPCFLRGLVLPLGVFGIAPLLENILRPCYDCFTQTGEVTEHGDMEPRPRTSVSTLEIDIHRLE